MAAVIPRVSESRASAWRLRDFTWLWLLSGITLLFWPTAASLGALWLDAANPSYTHGFLVLAVTVALLWRAAGELAPGNATRALRSAGLVGLLVAAFAWLFAYRAGI